LFFCVFCYPVLTHYSLFIIRHSLFMLYDLAILGGGPAGVAGGVYASRKRLKTVFITESFGGQSIESAGVENWIGTISIPGPELAQALKKHLLAYAGDIVDVKEGESVIELTTDNRQPTTGFKIRTNAGEYLAKTVLITTGSSRRKLDIPGAKEFENKGITYCASCDGPLFSDKDVVVIGGGNAGFETAAQLSAYCKSVTLITHGPFRADPVTVEKVLSHPNVMALENATPVEIKGDKFVKSITYTDDTKHMTVELPAEGIFVEIGLIPNTEYLKDVVGLNQYNQIIIDPKTQQTKTAGVWAAGDATDTLYHQNNIAAGDAVRALEDIYTHLHAK
jgi:alkyl hydroperoxide reductase subunit F